LCLVFLIADHYYVALPQVCRFAGLLV